MKKVILFMAFIALSFTANTVAAGLTANQLWQGQTDSDSTPTQFRLFISAINGDEVCAILETISGNDSQLYLLTGGIDSAGGKIDLRTVGRLSTRANKPPRITGELSSNKQALNTTFSYLRSSEDIELQLVANPDDAIRDVFEPARRLL